MSNRVRSRGGRSTRTAGRSYTARLQRTRAYRPPRRLPAWLTDARWVNQPRVPAVLVLLAEAGHLAAAWTEWPAGTARGLFHVVIAGILGVAAVAIYFGPDWRPEVSAAAVIPLVIATVVLVPLCWAVGSLAGLTPYLHYPVIAAGINTAVELVAAVLMAIGWLALRGSRLTRRPRPG